MAKLYVTSPRSGDGKSAVAVGLRQLLKLAEADVVEGDGTPQVVVVGFRGERTLEGVPPGALGVILNQVPNAQGRYVERELRPAVEAKGLTLLGVIPEVRALRSARVGDLAAYLGGEVVAGHDFLDNEFQSVMIGAMSHQGATTLPYFHRMEKKVVVTGGDRIDIHMGALGTPTEAIVATAGYAPDPVVVERAEAENTPIISVLPETPEIVDKIGEFLRGARFGPSKAAAAAELVRQHVDVSALESALGLSVAGAR